MGYYENFMTGFWAAGERRAEVWGRPAALAITKDGALLVADDTGGTIWKVRYTGEAPAGAPPVPCAPGRCPSPIGAAASSSPTRRRSP